MIKKLKVHNYRSLREVELLLGPINVLVGPNMGGKSNIVDVFRFLYDFSFPHAGVDGLHNALAQRAGVDEVIWKGGDDRLISLSLETVRNGSLESEFSYTLEIIAGQGGYSSVQREALTARRGGTDVPLIVEESGSRWFANADQRKLGSVSVSRSALQNAPPNWDGYEFAQSVASWRFYQLVPAIMKQRTQMTVASQALDTHGGNLSAWLMGLQTRFPEVFARVTEVVRDLFPDVKDLLTWPSQDGLVHLAAREEGLKRPVNVWQMSDGELTFIALLSLLYSPPEFGADLFCVEEPENHLHPRLLETLVALLRQIRQEVVDSKRPSAQLIVTTQSPYLVDQMSVDEVIWVEKGSGETKAFHPSDQAHLRKLVEDKELGLGDLMYSGTLGEDR